jgi:hypothetical protein
MSMKKILISLTEKQHKTLTKESLEHEICLSELIRRIFDDYIEKILPKGQK